MTPPLSEIIWVVVGVAITIAVYGFVGAWLVDDYRTEARKHRNPPIPRSIR